MPTTNSEYGETTTASTVASMFSSRIKDKIVLITGVNLLGAGGSTAAAFAAHSPSLLILAGRTANKLNDAAASIAKDFPGVSTKTLILDLGSQKAVRLAANQLLQDSEIPHIDMLINNAGVMSLPERQLTEEGIEMHFATNHVGHFLFTNLIMPKLIKAAQQKGVEKGSTRIVNLTSRGVVYSPIRFSDLAFTKTWDELPDNEKWDRTGIAAFGRPVDTAAAYVPEAAYGQSKTANVLFSVSLNDLLFAKHGILSVAVHPGFVQTELARYADQEVMKKAFELAKKSGYYLKNLDEGAATTAVAALDPKLTPGDFYLADCQTVPEWVPQYCSDPAIATRLWKVSEDLVGQNFDF